jgi:hypothetical protein
MTTIREDLDAKIAVQQSVITTAQTEIDRLQVEKVSHESMGFLDKEESTISTWFDHVAARFGYVKV